jgi:hypothetical protein
MGREAKLHDRARWTVGIKMSRKTSPTSFALEPGFCGWSRIAARCPGLLAVPERSLLTIRVCGGADLTPSANWRTRNRGAINEPEAAAVDLNG